MTTYTVSSGVTSTGVTLNAGDVMDVFGTASGTIVDSGGLEKVYPEGTDGGTASGTTVNSGGTELVAGAAFGTTVNGGGIEHVTSGGIAFNVTVNGGVQNVEGTASATTVNSGGEQDVYYVASATTVNSGGTEFVQSGGTASRTIVNSGGTEEVLVGAIGGSAGIAVSAATLQAGAIFEEVGLLVSGAGTVLSLAPITSTVSNFTVTTTGTFSNVVSALSATVISGGEIVVSTGGGALDTTVSSGGTEYVLSGGTTRATTINGGTEIVSSGGTGDGTTISAGKLDLAAGASAGGAAITFAGSSGTLQIDGTTMPTNTISGLVVGDTIDLTGLAFVSGHTSASLSGTTLTVTNGTTIDTLNLSGAAAGKFVTSPDTGATPGTLVNLVTPSPTAGNAQLRIAAGQSIDLTDLLLALDTPGLPGDTLKLTAATGGTPGKVMLDSSTGDLSYTAPSSGSPTAISYTVTDETLGTSATGTVAITLDQNLAKNDTITLSGAAGSGNIIDGLGGKNISVSLTGSNNTVLLGDGNDSVSFTGNNNTVILGNGNDTVSVNGGTGESITAGTGNDVFNLDASMTSLTMHGLHDTVSVNGGADMIVDTPGGADKLQLQIGAQGGTVSVTNFGVTNAVVSLVQALASAEGWTSPAQIAAAVTTDHGDGLLSKGNLSIDFVGVTGLTAKNFQIS